jgi:hypothetical protein
MFTSSAEWSEIAGSCATDDKMAQFGINTTVKSKTAVFTIFVK